MKTPLAEFVVSAFSPREFPKGELLEVVFAGRSNVGKSSLINRLARCKNLARTSTTPGKTQSINFYKLNNEVYLVDLPGFGYAKVGKSFSKRWKLLIERYFETRRNSIAMVVQLVDSRISPTALDLDFARWLDHLRIPRMLVATKADKISGNQRAHQVKEITTTLASPSVILSSTVSGVGCKEIWQRIREVTHNKISS